MTATHTHIHTSGPFRTVDSLIPQKHDLGLWWDVGGSGVKPPGRRELLQTKNPLDSKGFQSGTLIDVFVNFHLEVDVTENWHADDESIFILTFYDPDNNILTQCFYI